MTLVLSPQVLVLSDTGAIRRSSRPRSKPRTARANIKIRRFVRFELGEGLEKKKGDFAAEVAKQAGLA